MPAQSLDVGGNGGKQNVAPAFQSRDPRLTHVESLSQLDLSGLTHLAKFAKAMGDDFPQTLPVGRVRTSAPLSITVDLLTELIETSVVTLLGRSVPGTHCLSPITHFLHSPGLMSRFSPLVLLDFGLVLITLQVPLITTLGLGHGSLVPL